MKISFDVLLMFYQFVMGLLLFYAVLLKDYNSSFGIFIFLISYPQGDLQSE